MVSVEQKCPRLCSHLGTITTKIVQDGRLLCSSVLQGRNIACYNKPKLEFIKIEDCHWRRVTCNRINHLHEGPGLCRGWSGGQLEIFIFGICAVEVGYRASFPATRGHLNELFTQRNFNELETHFISVPFRLDIEPAFLQHDTENKMNINDLTTNSRFVKWQSHSLPLPDSVAVGLHLHLRHHHRHVQGVPVEPAVLVGGVEVVEHKLWTRTTVSTRVPTPHLLARRSGRSPPCDQERPPSPSQYLKETCRRAGTGSF